MDPEIVEMVQFLDPEIVEKVDISYITPSCMQKLVRLLAENLSCSQVWQDYWTKQHYALKAEEIGKT